MLQKAYVFYYLAPDYRNLAPLNKLKITNDCPSHLRDKIYEIPTKLYLKGEKRKVDEKEIQANIKKIKIEQFNAKIKEKENEIVQQEILAAQQSSANKNTVKILENRLILPAATIGVEQNLKTTTGLESKLIEVSTNKQQQIKKR